MLRNKKAGFMVAIAIGVSSSLLGAKPANAIDIKGLFTGIYKDIIRIPTTVVDQAWRNPVGTAKILNSRVFKIKGSEKFFNDAQKYYDKYYGREILNVLRGGQPSSSLLISIAAKESGLLPNGIPRDLNAILDTILGPESNQVASACSSFAPGGCKYTKFLEELQNTPVSKAKREAILASTGAAGLPNPYLVRRALLRAGKQGYSNDQLLQNPVAASISEANETDRTIVRAYSESILGEQGQQNTQDEIAAIGAGLEGVNETAKTGLQATTTQDAVKAGLAVDAQVAGFLGIIAADSKQQKFAGALTLNQLANISQSNDALRRSRDAEVIAEAKQALFNSRVRPLR